MTSISEFRAALSKMHARACGDASKVYMSIPADPERDADLLLSTAIDRLEQEAGVRIALVEAVETLLFEVTAGPSDAATRSAVVAAARAALQRARTEP